MPLYLAPPSPSPVIINKSLWPTSPLLHFLVHIPHSTHHPHHPTRITPGQRCGPELAARHLKLALQPRPLPFTRPHRSLNRLLYTILTPLLTSVHQPNRLGTRDFPITRSRELSWTASLLSTSDRDRSPCCKWRYQPLHMPSTPLADQYPSAPPCL